MTDIKEFGEYTSWSGRKTFKKEKEMVIRAVDAQEDDEIKKYLAPLVEYWGRGFKKHSKTKVNNEEFFEAGFMYLDLGLKKYYERLEEEKVDFKFSTYFEWFIRQGFLDYIKRQDQK